MLFVRACKCRSPFKRVLSVYRRQYGNYENDTMYIAGILASLCDKYNVITTSQLLTDMNPDNHWKFGNKLDGYFTTSVNILISHIGHTNIDKFGGFISPIRFRSN